MAQKGEKMVGTMYKMNNLFGCLFVCLNWAFAFIMNIWSWRDNDVRAHCTLAGYNSNICMWYAVILVLLFSLSPSNLCTTLSHQLDRRKSLLKSRGGRAGGSNYFLKVLCIYSIVSNSSKGLFWCPYFFWYVLFGNSKKCS